jgi:hypothetical protein
MGRFNFEIDEAAILKAYRISPLDPTYVTNHGCAMILDGNDSVPGDGKILTTN